jgi:hypothetical protein
MRGAHISATALPTAALQHLTIAWGIKGKMDLCDRNAQYVPPASLNSSSRT